MSAVKQASCGSAGSEISEKYMGSYGFEIPEIVMNTKLFV